MSDYSSEGYELSLDEAQITTQATKHTLAPTPGSKQKESGDISRKRKASDDIKAQSGASQRLSIYVPAYNDLFNATVAEINGLSHSQSNYHPYRAGRIGLSFWTTMEKEAFFAALDRKGALDVRGISRMVGTKSEPEVRTFILALQAGYAAEHQTVGRNALLDYSEIPAAFEIGLECEKRLETAADALAVHQALMEERIEKARHGSNWLLTACSIVEFDTDLDQTDGTTLASAMEVFNIAKMIELSSRIFMNSICHESEWQDFGQDASEPGIYATAFTDFHNLLVGITRRIISSAIFLAESRREQKILAVGRGDDATIKRCDVESACRMLGLDRELRKYWINVPRRCGLNVLDDHGDTMAYENVERVLRHDTTLTEREGEGVVGGIELDVISPALREREDGSLSDEEDGQERRAEMLDDLQNMEEENRLWAMLGQANKTMAVVKNELDSERYLPPRRQEKSAVFWQDKVAYNAEWHSDAGPPAEEFFVAREKEHARMRRQRHSTLETVQHYVAQGHSLESIEDDDRVNIAGAMDKASPERPEWYNPVRESAGNGWPSEDDRFPEHDFDKDH